MLLERFSVGLNREPILLTDSLKRLIRESGIVSPTQKNYYVCLFAHAN